MANVYIVVDMQNDFLTGALGAKECLAVVDPIVKMINKNVKEEDIVLFTRDTHNGDTYLTSKEGSQIPPHCYFSTPGWELEPRIQNLYESLLKKFPGQVATVNKKTFGSDFLLSYFSEHEAEIDKIVLCGVCTSICVMANAVISRTACPNSQVIVVSSCCGDGNAQASAAALASLKALQIDVVESL